MTPVNIQRDGWYCNLKTSDNIPFGTPYSHTNTTPGVNTDGLVHDDYFSASSDYTATNTMAAGWMATFGGFIAPPLGDRQPYRVHASILIPVDGDAMGCITLGWGPATITGTNDLISQPKQLAFYVSANSMFVCELAPTVEEGRPLFVGVSVAATKQLTDATIQAHVSCQNLGLRPPTMQNAIS